MTIKRNRLSADKAIKTVSTIRRNNLRGMVGEGKSFDNQAALANALRISESHLSQLIGHKPIRRITETAARKFEYQLKLLAGSLDVAG